MADAYASFSTTPDSLGTIGAPVTPGNTDLPATVKGVVCLTAGNITVVPYGNADAVTLAFVDVPAGFVPPYRVRRVTAATATVATIEG
ncbi:hypothetical protein [Rhizobium sp. SGZ-381]|uniref:spike base protein, RCAP_Rcc01079 family n=1 Tax=Rhizobium sp. SGZ-381 TaxID=3342800 RepID=UPI00366BFE0C